MKIKIESSTSVIDIPKKRINPWMNPPGENVEIIYEDPFEEVIVKLMRLRSEIQHIEQMNLYPLHPQKDNPERARNLIVNAISELIGIETMPSTEEEVHRQLR